MKFKHKYRKLNEEEFGKEVFECVKCGHIKGQEKPKKLYKGIVDEDLVRGIIRTYQDVLKDKFNVFISEDDKGFSEDFAIKELCEVEIK